MIFNQDAFDAKLKKAMDAINKLSKSMEEAEEATKQAKEDLKENLKKQKPIIGIDPAAKSNYAVTYNNGGYVSNSNPWIPTSVDKTWNTSVDKTWYEDAWNSFGKNGFKQEFGKVPAYPSEPHDWMESKDDYFNEHLIETITTIYNDSYGEPKEVLQGKTGKYGECYVFSTLKTKAKAYVWSEENKCWFMVPYEWVVDYWNKIQNKKLDSWSSNTYGNHGINFYPQEKVVTIKTVNNGSAYSNKSAYDIGYVDKISANKIKFTPLPDNPEDKLKKYYESIFTNYVVQKTKPSNPKEGTIWSKLVTGNDWQIYAYGYWTKLPPADKAICADIIAKKMNEKLEPKSQNKKATGSGLFFRGNCSKWHEVIDPEKTVIQSVNGKYQWFMSAKSSDIEYGCSHDFKRIMPVFTTEQKVEKEKEISAKQNGQMDTTYYIQIGTGTKQNWSEIHTKQTIMVGNRPFHHNSGNKTWYMCLTFDEMKFAKMFTKDNGIEINSNFVKDIENIFVDAFPVGKFGFAWFYDGTKESAKSTAEQLKENTLYEVQEIANNLEYQSNTSKNKKKEKDMSNPTVYSEYQISDYDIMQYLVAFDHIYDDVYSMQQFKNKAVSLHKYLMHDIKLAMLKKNKKKFDALIESLEKLQEKYQEAEQYHVIQNKNQGLYLKPISKVQNLFGYHFDNDYGMPN